jgi:hypothetical protein
VRQLGRLAALATTERDVSGFGLVHGKHISTDHVREQESCPLPLLLRTPTMEALYHGSARGTEGGVRRRRRVLGVLG